MTIKNPEWGNEPRADTDRGSEDQAVALMILGGSRIEGLIEEPKAVKPQRVQ